MRLLALVEGLWLRVAAHPRSLSCLGPDRVFVLDGGTSSQVRGLRYYWYVKVREWRPAVPLD